MTVIVTGNSVWLSAGNFHFHHHNHFVIGSAANQFIDGCGIINVGTPLLGWPQIPHCENGHPGTGVPTVELLWHGEVADQYIRQMDAFYRHLSVDQYVIMPDHIHLLITIHAGHTGRDVPTRTSEIARFVGTFKRFCNKEYGSNIWQSRYYDHVVRNQQDYNEIWEYIENNPTKWPITKDMR